MKALISLLISFALTFNPLWVHRTRAGNDLDVPKDIKAVFDKALYKDATWGLRVVDLSSGETLIDLQPNSDFFIGSIRKVFTVGELLNEIGAGYRFNTAVYRRGQMSRAGVLHGDLILLASGDLTVGGRTNPDGSIAISNLDHNEADSLGNAILTKPDAVAGYRSLARQVAQTGITEITGNVIIDDRLFQPYNFRGEFNLRPIFVNDDAVDVSIRPGSLGKLAEVTTRPVSLALAIENQLVITQPKSKSTPELEPHLPQCIGQPHCTAKVTGELPIDFVPPLTNKFPLVQTFRIVEPSNYARTVFIEALEQAGVKVDAPDVAQNPTELLPAKGTYKADVKVAELQGLPYSEYAKFILKVSYNIGADTSLLFFGLHHGVDNMADALRVEKEILTTRYGIPADEFHFIDGSGGGDSKASNRAVTQMLRELKDSPAFPAFFDGLPILGVDASLSMFTDFQSDPTLAGATGQVRAKTGTYLVGTNSGLLIKGQGFGGYIATKNRRHLAYELVVNNVPLKDFDQLLQVFQDEATISAILWRDN